MTKNLKSVLAVICVLLSVGSVYAEVGYGGGGSESGGGGGGVYVANGGSGFNWSNYISPVVNLLGGGTGGTVLGASTTGATCVYMIPHQVIGIGLKNDPAQVKLLQQFLNREMGSKLPVTGVFGLATKKAAQSFQTKYKADILTPWGLSNPTAFVYYSTIAKINAIMCSQNPSLDNQYLIVVPKFFQLFNH